jgi:phenylacetate-CoA ligase
MLATPELIQEAAQPHRLAAALPRWLQRVPLYRRAQLAPGLVEPASALEHLRRLPLITKQDIRRDFPRNFLGDSAALDDLLDREVIELEHTSGTSEERTPLLLPYGWWAEQELRALQLNPFIARVLEKTPQARRVTISSPVCSGEICYTGVPSRDERIVGNALFLSLSRYPFLWSESELARMAAEAVEWQPRFLDVDPVYGVVFALYCERHGIRLPSLQFILCSYEFVSVVHRRILERVFGVPVFNLYGSTETGHLLMEDEQGQMRPSLETALLEVSHTNGGELGELIVSTLTNEFMPLLRYRIGDLVEKRELPYGTRYRVHGRAADTFPTPQGHRVTIAQIDQCFAGVGGIAHYQLLERNGGPWQVRFVPDGDGPSPIEQQELKTRLTQLLEPASGLALEPTDLLLPESSGKFRLGYPILPISPGPLRIPTPGTAGVCRSARGG